jgi:uncharacterized damage-inducible protein DinB
MAEQQAPTREQEFARVRDYLNAMGAKWSPAEIIGKVRDAQAAVIQAAAAIPAARFSTPPAEGEWSAQEVLQHVLKYSVSCGHSIVSTMQSGTPSPIPPDRMERATERATLEQARERLLAGREELFTTVLAGDPAAFPDAVAFEHMWFGPLSWKATLLFLRVHDLDHARQIETIAAAG